MLCEWYCCVTVFFFKQKTAYEMRISDWSSDVCSSDLQAGQADHMDFPDEQHLVPTAVFACCIMLLAFRMRVQVCLEEQSGRWREDLVGAGCVRVSGRDRKSVV